MKLFCRAQGYVQTLARMSPPRQRPSARPRTANATVRSAAADRKRSSGRGDWVPDFDHVDTNNDGVVDRAEWEAFQKSQSRDSSASGEA